ncbi:gluconate 2-dehydrogenase subunit 3 family protein [Methylacidiphilum caldifontis]|uniref:gluconate 2-dehydrogenase subunit 3 family protein n=1 Tax=Methylacidiphilum caldifontis TaxID=2795386 RepID=UPI001F5CA49F|nr:gluconate 2-dehydrogenase subunit 3 family protein [Methylacidiphilum caldifontis]
MATSPLVENGFQNGFLSDLQQKNLRQFIALVVPHQGEAFEKARNNTFDSLLHSWSKDADVKKQEKLKAYLDLLQRYAQKTSRKDFYSLSSSEGTEIIQQTESQKIFQDLLNQILSVFYNNHGVWAAIGYPGPSMNDNGKYLGGYVNKGFDQLSW